MRSNIRHPAVVLAALGAVSGWLGTFGLDVGYGEAPHLGLHMMLTGLWFGLVVALGVWRWGNRSLAAAFVALAGTWTGWEVAVNLALQISENWLKAAGLSGILRTSAAGFAAGAAGAGLTWIGAAAVTPSLRRISLASSIVATGAVFGLLLPLTNHYDNPIVLLFPWQVAVASVLGLGLARQDKSHPEFSAQQSEGSRQTASSWRDWRLSSLSAQNGG